MKTKKLGQLTKREAEVWQAAQLELVEQLLEHGANDVNLMGLLKDWESILIHNPKPSLSQSPVEGSDD